MAKHYDIELIDINPEIENFTYEGVSEKDFKAILEVFESKEDFLKFKCKLGPIEQDVVLERKFFRGVMSITHISRNKTIHQENQESAKEVSKINLQKIKRPASGVVNVK